MSAGVAICGDLESHGIDPDALTARLEAEDVRVSIVPGPCDRTDAARWNGWSRTVFAVCPGGPSDEEVRARARRAGVDPGVGVASVDVAAVSRLGPDDRREERAAVVLRARAAGIASSPPSPPGAFRMALPGGKVSRRSLLSFGGIRYVPVASVGEAGCRGSVACGVCVEACPVGAIHRGGSVPRVDADVCIGCGACVSACPVDGAARVPGADLVRFESELAALTASGERAGIVVGCSGAPDPPGERLAGTWLPVEVPCLSIVTPAWALASLAAGAGAVALAGCGGGCRAGGAERIEAIVDFSREALSQAGVADPEVRVRLLVPEDGDRSSGPEPEDLPPLGAPSWAPSLREPAASVRALAALGATRGNIANERAPLGRVTFDSSACTMCGLCASVCPTGAIRFDQGVVAAALDLDRSACIGCGHCSRICPERALAIEPVVDLDRLGGVPEPLKRSTLARCRRCGEPVAPTAMLERLRPSLDPSLLATIEGLCQRCRGLR
jgi:ferredoxin